MFFSPVGKVPSTRLSCSSTQCGKAAEKFHVPTFSVLDSGGPGGKGTSAPLRLVRYVHVSRAAHQKSAESKMRWQIQDLVIASRHVEAIFSLTGEDVAESIEGVEIFKLLGWPLDRLDNNLMEALRNIRKAQQVLYR